MLPSGNMHIQKVQSSDAGWYQVSAKNTITGEQVTAKNSIFLKVTRMLMKF